MWLFLCVVGQVSGRVPSTPIFAFIAGPLTADGSTTAGMWGSLGGWPTFAPLDGLLERAAANRAAEYNACNVIPTDCRCKALQVTTNQAYRCCAHALYNAWLSFWLWLSPKCMHTITCLQESVHVLYMMIPWNGISHVGLIFCNLAMLKWESYLCFFCSFTVCMSHTNW